MARFAFLTTEFPTEGLLSGGLGAFVDRLARSLNELGHSAEIFTITHGPASTTMLHGLRVQRIALEEGPFDRVRRTGPWRRSDAIAQLARTLDQAWVLARALNARDRDHPFDVVHSSDYDAISLFVGKRRGRRTVVRCSWARDLFHDAEHADARLPQGDRWVARLERWCVRRAAAAYAPSRYLADYMTRRHGLRVEVVRPPVFVEWSADEAATPAVPEHYLLHFGLMGRRKGTDLLADALLLAWQEAPDLRMVWAGPEALPGFVARCRSRWGASTGHVTWLGKVSKPVVYSLLRRASAAVVPSRADNLPNTALEALASGVPVVGFDGASLNELVDDSRGALAPMSDTAALARLMVRAWRAPAAVPRRPLIPEEFEPGRATRQLLDFLHLTDQASCSTAPLQQEHTELRLTAVHPAQAIAGQPFNPQPDGASAIWVECQNASPWTRIVLGDVALQTAYGTDAHVSALVPKELLARPGRLDVRLHDGPRQSNPLPFVIVDPGNPGG